MEYKKIKENKEKHKKNSEINDLCILISKYHLHYE